MRGPNTINPNKQETPGEVDRISWHPAFFEAVQMELDEYRNNLEFSSEFQLVSEPLRIDVLIIKKPKDLIIRKNIASIFRNINIVEYKSPDDYLSIKNFYLVYAYACIYISREQADISDITLTFVENRYPRELITHLKEIRKFSVEENRPGIYIIKGDIIPIQIINSRKLPAEENIWFRNLSNELEVSEIKQVLDEIEKHGKAVRIGAYLDAIARANRKKFREINGMAEKYAALKELLEDFGFNKEYEAKGKAEGKAEVAANMLKEGLTAEQTARLSGLDISKVMELSNS